MVGQFRVTDRTAIPSLGLPVLSLLAWVALAMWHPGTAYHLAPAIVAASWSVALQLEAPLTRAMAAASSLTGGAMAVSTTLVLSAWDLLRGPALPGMPGVESEAMLLAAAGAVLGFGMCAGRGRAASTHAATPDGGRGTR